MYYTVPRNRALRHWNFADQAFSSIATICSRAFLPRDIERRHAVLTLDRSIRAPIEQHPHHVSLARRCRLHQRCPASPRLRIHVGARLDQQLKRTEGRLPAHDRVAQQRNPVRPGRLVDVRKCRQQRLGRAQFAQHEDREDVDARAALRSGTRRYPAGPCATPHPGRSPNRPPPNPRMRAPASAPVRASSFTRARIGM